MTVILVASSTGIQRQRNYLSECVREKARLSSSFAAASWLGVWAISVYMATAVALPDITADSIVDLREHYFAHRSWFFGFMLSGVVFSAAKEFALTGHLPGRLNGEFHVIFALTAILAALIRREWFHELLAPVFAALFLLYITLLFGRL